VMYNNIAVHVCSYDCATERAAITTAAAAAAKSKHTNELILHLLVRQLKPTLVFGMYGLLRPTGLIDTLQLLQLDVTPCSSSMLCTRLFWPVCSSCCHNSLWCRSAHSTC
jgi:hypothetical protein